MSKTSYNIWLFLFLVFVLLNHNSVAQVKNLSANQKQISADSSVTSLWDDIDIGLNTGYKIFSSPAKFKSEDWIYAGSALAATGITVLIDNDIRNNFKNNHSTVLDKVAEVGHNYGNAAYAVAFSGTIYLGGKIFKDENFSTTGRMLLEGLFYAGLTTTILKSVIGRSRPYTEDGPSRFNGFQLKTETTSMPSGHVTVAFAVSSVLAERIDNFYTSIFLYSLAASTVFQRIYSDSHWASDCIPAAVIGYVIGKAVVKYDGNKTPRNISVSTYYFPNGAGLNFQYTF